MNDNSQNAPVLDLTLQLGLIRLDVGVGDSADSVYRPRAVMWVDEQSGMVLNVELSEPKLDYLPIIGKTLDKVCQRLGGIPRQVQLRNPRLARDLREALEPSGIEVVVRESLPALDEAAKSLSKFGTLAPTKPEPGLLDVPGMELDNVIAFAEAAEAFYDATPWKHLIDDDLIEIHAPVGPKGTRFTQVLGAGGEIFGLGFVESPEQHESIRDGNGLPKGGAWSLQFGDIDDLRFTDGELWEQHNLPLACEQAYPLFARFTKTKIAPPTPQDLAFAEGLLRAIAQTTEDELDSGQWEKSIQTATGPMTYKLSLPILLEQMSGKAAAGAGGMRDVASMRATMESMLRALGQQIQSSGAKTPQDLNQLMDLSAGGAPKFVPTTDAERAQQLAFEAQQARGRRQVQLARQALKIDPDCADALLLLAHRNPDLDESIPLLQRAVAAAERELGEHVFEEHAGHFWLLTETRPYMRARAALASALLDAGRNDEAIDHLRDMLRLNPGDNQGIRYILAESLLRANKLDDLDALLNNNEYADDMGADWQFIRLLLAYRRNGDSPEARKQFDDAVRANSYVVPMLTGRMQVPPPPPYFSPGDVSEAAVCVEQLGDVWIETPGAVEWLEQQSKRAVKKQSKRAVKKQPKGKSNKKRKKR